MATSWSKSNRKVCRRQSPCSPPTETNPCAAGIRRTTVGTVLVEAARDPAEMMAKGPLVAAETKVAMVVAMAVATVAATAAAAVTEAAQAVEEPVATQEGSAVATKAASRTVRILSPRGWTGLLESWAPTSRSQGEQSC